MPRPVGRLLKRTSPLLAMSELGSLCQLMLSPGTDPVIRLTNGHFAARGALDSPPRYAVAKRFDRDDIFHELGEALDLPSGVKARRANG